MIDCRYVEVFDVPGHGLGQVFALRRGYHSPDLESCMDGGVLFRVLGFSAA